MGGKPRGWLARFSSVRPLSQVSAGQGSNPQSIDIKRFRLWVWWELYGCRASNWGVFPIRCRYSPPKIVFRSLADVTDRYHRGLVPTTSEQKVSVGRLSKFLLSRAVTHRKWAPRSRSRILTDICSIRMTTRTPLRSRR